MHCSSSPQSSLGRQSKVIEQICQRLTDVCSDDHTREADEQDTTRQVVQVVTALGHAFTKLVDLMLSREIKVGGKGAFVFSKLLSVVRKFMMMNACIIYCLPRDPRLHDPLAVYRRSW